MEHPRLGVTAWYVVAIVMDEHFKRNQLKDQSERV